MGHDKIAEAGKFKDITLALAEAKAKEGGQGTPKKGSSTKPEVGKDFQDLRKYHITLPSVNKGVFNIIKRLCDAGCCPDPRVHGLLVLEQLQECRREEGAGMQQFTVQWIARKAAVDGLDPVMLEAYMLLDAANVPAGDKANVIAGATLANGTVDKESMAAALVRLYPSGGGDPSREEKLYLAGIRRREEQLFLAQARFQQEQAAAAGHPGIGGGYPGAGGGQPGAGGGQPGAALQGPSRLKCWQCGQLGHKKPECPNKPKLVYAVSWDEEKSGRGTSVVGSAAGILDTGCGLTVVGSTVYRSLAGEAPRPNVREPDATFVLGLLPGRRCLR